MSAFTILFIVVTTIYIFYYSVVIWKDLYSKPVDKKTDTEDFDISDMVGKDKSLTVREEGEGFTIESHVEPEETADQEQEDQYTDSIIENNDSILDYPVDAIHSFAPDSDEQSELVTNENDETSGVDGANDDGSNDENYYGEDDTYVDTYHEVPSEEQIEQAQIEEIIERFQSKCETIHVESTGGLRKYDLDYLLMNEHNNNTQKTIETQEDRDRM